ncbi:MAG: metal-dependent transcriptional regulator [Planctomycetota bacterium]|jgi:DtxR family Mn-dependent transcriptional regulator
MTLSTNEKLSASLEDYLEAIYNVSDSLNVARSKDIAEALDVSRASVTGALKALSEKGLINYKPYGYVTLTEPGRQIALRIVRRHEILNQFFEDILGVDHTMAHEAACRTEHTLGPEITARLMAFMEFLGQSQDDGQDIIQRFREYWKIQNKAQKRTEK